MPDLDLALGEPEPPEVEPAAGDGGPWNYDAGTDTGAAGDPLAGLELEQRRQVEEPEVRAFLIGVSSVPRILFVNHPANDLFGPPALWELSEAELDSLTPIATRMANRRPQLAAAIEQGDTLAALAIFGGYGARNLSRMRTATQAAQDPNAGEAVDPSGLVTP